MRYIMTIIWAVLIGAAVSYVLSSMAAEPFAIMDTVVLSAIFAITAMVLGDGILKPESK